MYEADDVDVVWHGGLSLALDYYHTHLPNHPVPSHEEIEFVLEILDKIAAPALDKVESLLETAGKWDNIARNDFCR